jgi:hypothetical protein
MILELFTIEKMGLALFISAEDEIGEIIIQGILDMATVS